MLPPFIIEQIRKREEEEARPEHRPAIELPLAPPMPRRRPAQDPDETDRGVVVIDL
ncbi:MAG: hypothetical protein OHK0013_05800 [Sandaracinaceae bacterium]